MYKIYHVQCYVVQLFIKHRPEIRTCKNEYIMFTLLVPPVNTVLCLCSYNEKMWQKQKQGVSSLALKQTLTLFFLEFLPVSKTTLAYSKNFCSKKKIVDSSFYSTVCCICRVMYILCDSTVDYYYIYGCWLKQTFFSVKELFKQQLKFAHHF